jgi:hypothetical protein
MMLEAFVTQMGEGAMETLWPQRLGDAKNQLMKLEMMRPVPKHKKRGRTWILSDNSGREDEDLYVVTP